MDYKASYLDAYKCCEGCPVYKECGTAVSSMRLCHSYKENKNGKNGRNERNERTDTSLQVLR